MKGLEKMEKCTHCVNIQTNNTNCFITICCLGQQSLEAGLQRISLLNHYS